MLEVTGLPFSLTRAPGAPDILGLSSFVSPAIIVVLILNMLTSLRLQAEWWGNSAVDTEHCRPGS